MPILKEVDQNQEQTAVPVHARCAAFLEHSLRHGLENPAPQDEQESKDETLLSLFCRVFDVPATERSQTPGYIVNTQHETNRGGAVISAASFDTHPKQDFPVWNGNRTGRRLLEVSAWDGSTSVNRRSLEERSLRLTLYDIWWHPETKKPLTNTVARVDIRQFPDGKLTARMLCPSQGPQPNTSSEQTMDPDMRDSFDAMLHRVEMLSELVKT